MNSDLFAILFTIEVNVNECCKFKRKFLKRRNLTLNTSWQFPVLRKWRYAGHYVTGSVLSIILHLPGSCWHSRRGKNHMTCVNAEWRLRPVSKVEIHELNIKAVFASNFFFLLWLCITTNNNCCKTKAPLSQPIRSKTKTNRDSLAHIFLRFASASSICFEFFSLRGKVCVLCVIYVNHQKLLLCPSELIHVKFVVWMSSENQS